MYKIYDKWPEIAKESYESSYDLIDFKNIDHVIFSGMGGSGTIGDIFSSILSKTNIHVTVNKGYHLPKRISSNSLVIPISVSGNTFETLTVLESAKKAEAKTIAFSGGGKMQMYCEKNNVNFRHIPIIHSPRTSLPRFLFAILKILKPIIPINTQEIYNSIINMEKSRKNISSQNLTNDNQSISIAEWISGIPIIYYPDGFKSAAIRFKNSLHENAKIHAMAEDVVEASHNNIVAWETQNTVTPILIRGQDDYFKTQERWNILKQFFETNDIDYKEIISIKGHILSKLMDLIYRLDYASIYLSILSKIDPSPIPSIDFFKTKLSFE